MFNYDRNLIGWTAPIILFSRTLSSVQTVCEGPCTNIWTVLMFGLSLYSEIQWNFNELNTDGSCIFRGLFILVFESLRNSSDTSRK